MNFLFPESQAIAPSRLRILHLEDSEPDAELVAAKLASDYPECLIQQASSRQQYENALSAGDFDLILSDYTLQGYDGLSALKLARTTCPDKPFIFLSGTIGEERAIEALKCGATDYVIKDRPSRLVPAIRQAIARHEEEQRLRQTQEALQQNRERFRQITENVADLILMLDLTGRCVYANPAYLATLGRQAQAGHDVFSDVHPDDRAIVRQLFQETLRTGVGGRAEYRVVHSDGSLRHVEAQSNVVRNIAGETTQVLVVARDVTERQAADERIRHQADLLNRAQDAILMRDMQDRITYWNHSAARIYGWSAEQAQGREANALWNEDRAQVETARHATLFYGEWTGEMRQRSRAGADLIMQSRWSLVQGRNGLPSGFLVINTDIAEKKRLEAQFLRVQRTESIGLLAGGVAHDINNALVPIMASSDMLESIVTDPEGKQFLASIRSSAQHGAALVRQLLAFARGAIGQHSELDLQPLLRDFVGFVAQTFPRNVELKLDALQETWRVRGDSTQLKQVFVNLCINARDAMPNGGRIVIRLENQVLEQSAAKALRELKPGPHVVLSVSDTGSGMEPAVLDRIFDPFFTTKEIGKGTGLGLAAVRGIVKGHGGTIAVESAPGTGTTFRIYLPAFIPAASTETNHPFAKSKLRGSGEGILLVDDEPGVRKILSALLSASGYHVMEAASGSEALAIFSLRGEEIALVLTDVTMADGDGFQLIDELRNRNVKTPLMMMSGLAAGGQYEERAKRLEVPMLAKPITRDALVSAVHSALASRAVA
ncbi:MAG TPA: PAS domain S-box protein [Opitutus sp.]|nr:PAS domain S-box protein [Opitutus sp.]